MFDLQKFSTTIYQSMKQGDPFLKNNHLVIIGNNTAGKTNFIKMILKMAKSDKASDIYYIDPLNRTINPNNNGTNELFADYSPYQILTYRIRTGVYNTKKDVFAVADPRNDAATNGAELAYNELCEYLDDYNTVFAHFMKKTLSPLQVGKIKENFKLIVNNDPARDFSSLSSSEIAIMRMLMEIEYAKKCECKYVIIDEFDAFLEISNMVKLLNSLIEYYVSLKFIVVIHNVEALIELNNIDVFLIKDSEVQNNRIWAEFFDGNDIMKLSKLDRMLHRHAARKISDIEEVLKNSITEYVKKGVVSDAYIERVRSVDVDNLSVRERVLYDYFLKVYHHEN